MCVVYRIDPLQPAQVASMCVIAQCGFGHLVHLLFGFYRVRYRAVRYDIMELQTYQTIIP